MTSAWTAKRTATGRWWNTSAPHEALASASSLRSGNCRDWTLKNGLAGRPSAVCSRGNPHRKTASLNRQQRRLHGPPSISIESGSSGCDTSAMCIWPCSCGTGLAWPPGVKHRWPTGEKRSRGPSWPASSPLHGFAPRLRSCRSQHHGMTRPHVRICWAAHPQGQRGSTLSRPGCAAAA